MTFLAWINLTKRIYTRTWIAGNQSKIEDTLYERSKNRGAVFLYDVTSSYFEGTQNELSDEQVEKLLRDGTFQLSLFEQNLAEISIEDGPRYVLRRNPVRGSEVAQAREDKLAFLRKKVAQKNLSLSEHPRANVDTALKAEVVRAKSLGISAWCQLSSSGRELCVAINEEAKKEAAKLDGCYVLKTDLAKAVVPKLVLIVLRTICPLPS